MRISKFICAFVALISFAGVAFADVNTPYSMYGYGVMGERATSKQRQMGGVGYAMQSGRQINAMNPASYACIDSLTFLWDMGADVSFLWNKDRNASDKSIGGGLDYITMQFPLSKHVGMSIGMLPLTQVGYSFGSDIKFGTRQNQGSGGINEAYAGISGKWGGFSVGANISYDFGTIQNDVYATPSTSGQTLFEHIMEIRDWNVLLGLQYRQPIGRYNDLTLGAVYSPKKSFHGNTWVTLQDLNSSSTPDTISSGKIKDRYYSPQTLGVGLSFTHERVHRVVVEADFTWQQWSKAKFSDMVDAAGQVVFQGSHFSDRRKFAVGAEYTHNVRGSYLERMPFRLGGFYTHDYVRIQGNDVKEYGLSLGTAFAAPQSKTLINFGLEWRHRQSSPVNLLTENFLSIMVGVNFNELWFYKRKIN